MAEPWHGPIPSRLAHLAATAAGVAWLDALPGIVGRCVDHWSLGVGEPYDDASVSLALPAVTPEHGTVVLKVQFPHRESRDEAEALRRWNGEGAVMLVDHEPALHALLLERCIPGSSLAAARSVDHLGVLCDLLPRLWTAPSDGFDSLRDESDRWVASLQRRQAAGTAQTERRLIEAAVELLGVLAPSQGQSVLLHQDLHGGNVLAARRSPWLAIDPKPLAGEREFAAAPVVRSAELGHGRTSVLHRFDRVTGELGLDRSRAAGWVIGQTVAWGFEGDTVLATHFETAGWLLEHRARLLR